MRPHLVAVLAITALLAGCTASPVEPTPAATNEIEWVPCAQGSFCADVPVPLDWSDPDGEQLVIAVIRHPAGDPDQRIGTLFFNPGGPGESGVAAVASGAAELDSWGDGRFDIIGWDPRGTGGSSPVSCFEDDAARAEFWDGVGLPSTPAGSQEYAQLTTALASRCVESMGELLSHISAGDTVRDLDHLRELVGDEQLTFVGLSYGTLLGQTYANMYPDRVRAMVLDGVVDPVAFTSSAEDRAAAGAASIDEVFDRFLELCDVAGAAACALAGHGEPARDRIAPVLSGPEPASGDAKTAISGSMGSPSTWPMLAELLDAAATGDATGLAAIAAQRNSPEVAAQLTVAAAIACTDGPAQQPVEEWPTVIEGLVAESRFGGAFQGWWQWAPCASGWPISPGRYAGPWDAVTEHPLLLIGMRYDPNTGYAGAVRTQALLGNAVLLTHDGYGHISVSDPSTCVSEIRTRYLIDIELPAPETICASDRQPFAD